MPWGSPGEDLFLILERQQHPGAVGHDLAVFDLQILLNHLRDAKVAQSLGCSLYRPLRGILPRGLARSVHFGDSVDSIGLGHCSSPLTGSPFPDESVSG